MFFILGVSMFLLYVYNHYMNIVYFLNDTYRSCKCWLNNFLNCKFEDIELNNIILNGVEYVFYEYSFNKNNYIIIANSDKFIKTPYNINTILNAHNSKSTIIKTKDSIIMANAITIDNKEIDLLDIVHKLCGPLGDFYKETPVEMDPLIIKLYIEKIKRISIKNLKLLSATGEEINLI